MTGRGARHDKLRGFVTDEVIDVLDLIDQMRHLGVDPVGYRLQSPYAPVRPKPVNQLGTMTTLRA